MSFKGIARVNQLARIINGGFSILCAPPKTAKEANRKDGPQATQKALDLGQSFDRMFWIHDALVKDDTRL